MEKFNVVCGHAEGRIDARFPSESIRQGLHRKITSILGKTYVRSYKGRVPTRTAFTLMNDCPPLEPSAEARVYATAYLASLRGLEGQRRKMSVSRGAADLNNMGRPGLVGLDGLGAWGGRMHSGEEFVYLRSLSTRATALADLLRFAEIRLS
jgi:glutamate carboxypeptidase